MLQLEVYIENHVGGTSNKLMRWEAPVSALNNFTWVETNFETDGCVTKWAAHGRKWAPTEIRHNGHQYPVSK